MSAIEKLLSWKYSKRSIRILFVKQDVLLIKPLQLHIYSYLSSSRPSHASHTAWQTSVFQKRWENTGEFYLKENQTWLKVRYKNMRQRNELVFTHLSTEENFSYSYYIVRTMLNWESIYIKRYSKRE